MVIMIEIIRNTLGCLPIEVSLEGRKRNLIVRVLDKVAGGQVCNEIDTKYGVLKICPSHEPQRLLAYCFANVMRYYEKSPLGRIIRSGKYGSTSFVDVGANLGAFSMIAQSVGMSAYAIEPEPDHAKFLASNTGSVGRVLQVALSDKAGELPLYYSRHNSGATSLVPASGYSRSTEAVEVTTFSSLTRSGALGVPDRISLIKIDVEGHEVATVGGLQDFLEEGHRPDLWCEVRGDLSGRSGGSFRHVRDMLARFGYAAVDGEGAMHVTPDQVLAQRGVFDLFFTVRH